MSSPNTHTVDFTPSPEQSGPPGLEREWLLANGTGGFAMGTIPNVNTRRYHGLLVAAARPPVGRVVVLNQMLEQVVLSRASGDEIIEFTTCSFGEQCAPNGYRMLTKFQRGLGVTWTYQFGEIEFVRELHLHWKQQAATIRYQISGLHRECAPGDRVSLRLLPMVTLRDFHSLLRRHSSPGFNVSNKGRGAATVGVNGQDLSATFNCHGSDFKHDEQWWYNFHYLIESQRGQDDREDAFIPGSFTVEFETPWTRTKEATFTVALGATAVEPITNDDARAAHLEPIARAMVGWVPEMPEKNGLNIEGLETILASATDDFVVARTVGDETLATVIAGYPWFADWGRDTFIALPGLLLATERFAEARSTFKTFARFIKDGLIPNVFDDYSDKAAHYNTVDASLWYIHAATEYVKLTGDQESWNQWLSQACITILDAYIAGTSYQIQMDADGLIKAGSPQTQLTWMDAARDGVIFTPRYGKAVEINALWYHALSRVGALIKGTQKAKAAQYNKLAKLAKKSFVDTFWDDARCHLIDTVYINERGETIKDGTLRPNQVFAISLEGCPLSDEQQELVLGAVQKSLWTPFGLRTLDPDSPQYHARFEGSPFDRDKAYHQGTAWPWLIGGYAEGVMRQAGFTKKSKDEAWRSIRSMVEELQGGGKWPSLGQLWEVHNGSWPHRPGGCMAQAWSVAEVTRIMKLIAEG